MTSVANAITQIRTRYLRGGRAERRNLLAANITDTDTSLTLKHDATGISRGMRLSIDLEDMHVHDVVPTSKTVTVERGAYGTTAAAHSADDVVVVGTPWSNADLLAAMNATLSDLESRGLFAIATKEATFDSGVDGYDLSGISNEILDVVDVWTRSPVSASKKWHRLDIGDWSLVTSADTTDFTSGTAIIMTRPGAAWDGTNILVKARTRFGRLSALTDDIETVTGLTTSGVDAMLLGTAVHLLAAAPMGDLSLDVVGDPRRDSEVTYQSMVASPSNLRRMYELQVRNLRTLLEAQHPLRLRVR